MPFRPVQGSYKPQFKVEGKNTNDLKVRGLKLGVKKKIKMRKGLLFPNPFPYIAEGSVM